MDKVHNPTPQPTEGSPSLRPHLSAPQVHGGRPAYLMGPQSLHCPQADSLLTMLSASKPPVSGDSCSSPCQDFSCLGNMLPVFRV